VKLYICTGVQLYAFLNIIELIVDLINNSVFGEVVFKASKLYVYRKRLSNKCSGKALTTLT